MLTPLMHRSEDPKTESKQASINPTEQRTLFLITVNKVWARQGTAPNADAWHPPRWAYGETSGSRLREVILEVFE